jgi:hypothetical protein
MLLQAARGPIASLPALVVGGPITGSWWGHPDHDEIFRVLNEATSSDQVVRLELVDGKVTLVHRRIWPALVRLADELGAARLAALHQEHTSSGAHRSTSTPFPDWVPAAVVTEGASLLYEDAIAQLPECLRDQLTAH